MVRALPPETRLVLLTFGAALSVWHLNPALASGEAQGPDRNKVLSFLSSSCCVWCPPDFNVIGAGSNFHCNVGR